jgi:hypothetical protein
MQSMPSKSRVLQKAAGKFARQWDAAVHESKRVTDRMD